MEGTYIDNVLIFLLFGYSNIFIIVFELGHLLLFYDCSRHYDDILVKCRISCLMSDELKSFAFVNFDDDYYKRFQKK